MVGWSAPAGAIVPALPAAMPATCVPWNEIVRVERQLAALAPGVRAGERARDDHLRRRSLTFGPLREAGRVRVARPAARNGLGLVDARRRRSPILIPSPVQPVQRRELGRRRSRRAAVRGERVADARVDAARRSRACSSRRRAARAGSSTVKPFEHDRGSAAARVACGIARSQLRRRRRLRSVRAARGRPRDAAERDVEPARRAAACSERAAEPRRERRHARSRDDHAHAPAAVRRPGSCSVPARTVARAGRRATRAARGWSAPAAGRRDDERRDEREQDERRGARATDVAVELARRGRGRFEGKRALVLGVANKRSIAWAIAQAARRRGRASSRSPSRASGSRRACASSPRPSASPLVTECDVRSDDDVARVFAEVGEAFDGELDLLVQLARLRRRGGTYRRALHRHAPRPLLARPRRQRVLARRVRASGGATDGGGPAAARS